MFKKYGARIITGLIILLFTILYTLPSTSLWSKMFGSLSPEEQQAVALSKFKYTSNGADTDLVVRAERTAPLFNKPNAPNVEPVLFKIANEVRQSLVDAKFDAKTTNTNYIENTVTITVKGKSEAEIKKVIEDAHIYANLPLAITKIFPEKKITLGLDLKGGLDLVYQVDKQSLQNTDETGDSVTDAVNRSVEIIRNRIDMYGIAEPSIRAQDGNRIRIQLPGVKDQERVKQLIQNTAMLQFHIVKESATSAESFFGFNPENEVIMMQSAHKGQAALWYRLNKKPEITGADLKYAKVSFDELGKSQVSLEFNSEGAAKFAQVTGRNVGKQLAIVLDNKVHSAPVIQQRITGGMAQITGHFTFEEASNLAIVLRAGALPATLTALESRVVGPTLGQKSIEAGLRAGILGFILVIIYMVFTYGLFGVFADVALIFNSLIVFSLLVYFGGTMTMPGIAGFILAVGMAVDANVIIFERIREEYKSGKTVRAAIAAGFDRAFSCILDSNVTTLVVVAILYNFSTGPIRGFATTLGIGLIANLYTAVVITKLLLDLKYGDGKTKSIKI